jgi:hypothetical protein
MEEKAKAFNETLEEALKQMEILRDLYSKMKKAETSFNTLSKEYSIACEKLRVIKPLELKVGFGALAFVGFPYGGSFQLPNFLVFLGSLEAYRLKVADYEDFKRTNPTFEKDVAETQEHDAKAAEWRRFGDGELGWKTFSIPDH